MSLWVPEAVLKGKTTYLIVSEAKIEAQQPINVIVNIVNYNKLTL